MILKFNLLTAILFTFLLIGCGGGNGDAPATGGGGGTGGGGNGGGGGGSGTASLSWTPPSTYTDNTAFNDLQGHNIYMDSGSGFVKIGTVTTDSTYQVTNLSTGTYIFSVTAFDSLGVESSKSLTATITI